jgi:hypothetical protein
MRYFPIEKDVSHLQILDGPVLAHTVILCLFYLSTFHDLDQYSSSWLLWTRIPTHTFPAFDKSNFPCCTSDRTHGFGIYDYRE